ncbi:MAG: nucleotidyltransferase family protein [Promethearchaeota archaeon]
MIRSAEIKNRKEPFSLRQVIIPLAEKWEANKFFPYLKRNHFPLLWAEDELEGIYSPTDLNGKLEEQRKEYDSIRGHFQEFHEQLQKQQIDYVLIKSVGICPSFPWESDNIDIYFQEGDVPKVFRILERLNYVRLEHINERYKTLYRRFEDGRSVTAVHVHSNVGWEGVPFIDLNFLWKNKKEADDDPEITIPGANDAFLITVAHAQYENREIRLADFVRLYYLASMNELDWEYIVWIADQRGWKEGLQKHLGIMNGYFEAILGKKLVSLQEVGLNDEAINFDFAVTNFPYSFPFRENFHLWYDKIKSDQIATRVEKWDQRIYSTFRTLKRKLTGYKRIQPTFLIGISGVDGTGKTIQTEYLDKILSISEIRTERVWIRGGVVRSMEWFNSFLHKNSKKHNESTQSQNRDTAEARQKILKNPLLQWIYKTIIFIETMVKFNFYIGRAKLKRKVIIADRTIYDAIVDLGIKFNDLNIWDTMFARLLIAFTPRHNVLFLLTADKELVLERKEDETNVSKLEKGLTLYQELVKRKWMEVVDTHLSLSQVHEKIYKKVFHEYFKKYGKKLYKFVNAN